MPAERTTGLPTAIAGLPECELTFYLPDKATYTKRRVHGIPGATVGEDRDVTVTGKGRIAVLKATKVLLARCNWHQPVRAVIRRADGPWVDVWVTP